MKRPRYKAGTWLKNKSFYYHIKQVIDDTYYWEAFTRKEFEYLPGMTLASRRLDSETDNYPCTRLEILFLRGLVTR
jgi:hypothetical protein